MKLNFCKLKVKQYSASKTPQGEKRISSGKIEAKEMGPLIGKRVVVRVFEGSNESHCFVSRVKLGGVGKYKIPYVSDKGLKEFVNGYVNAKIIEVWKK